MLPRMRGGKRETNTKERERILALKVTSNPALTLRNILRYQYKSAARVMYIKIITKIQFFIE